MRQKYDATFFEHQTGQSYEPAGAMMPRVLSLCELKSIAICGIGIWLHACQELGITDNTDHSYVDQCMLKIPVDRFVERDLALAVDLNRQFDHVLSLEVGKHLPPQAAATFIGMLTRHAPVVLFCTAVPNQGGVNHVNGGPTGYWASLFADRGHQCIDWLHDHSWIHENVAWWYRQNLHVFVKRETFEKYSKLVDEAALPPKIPLDIIHPEMLSQRGLSTFLHESSTLEQKAIHRARRRIFDVGRVPAPVDAAKVRSIG